MSHNNDTILSGIPMAEGVHFKLGSASAFAVRTDSKDIDVRVRNESHALRRLLSRIPLLRGVVRLLCAVIDFFSALNQSGRMNPQRVVRCSAFTRYFADLFSTTPQTLRALLCGLLIPVILIAALSGVPALIEYGLITFAALPRFAVNIICCAFRLSGALLAVYAICHMRPINRLCMYRGAVSKVINASEAYGPGLTHEDALLSSRLTDASDGAFAIVVLLASIIGFSAMRTDGLVMQLAYRIGVILASSAVLNELILPLERALPDTIGAALRTPLMALQHLFTIEPHNQMIEVAICAYRAAYENDVD